MDSNELLPIRGITIRLKLLRHIYTPFYHQPQLKPFLKELLQDKARLDNENGLWLDAIESGRTDFKKNDEYRFNLFCTAPAFELFIKLLAKIRRLPHSYPSRREQDGLFANNLEFIGLLDYFTLKPLTHHNELFCYDAQALQREQQFWQQQDTLTLRFISPARFKIIQKDKAKPPYIRDRGVLQAGETERRVFRALCNLSPAIKQHCAASDISYSQVTDRLFWTDNAQTLNSGKIAPFGGVLGDITLSHAITNNNPHLPLLILGQYIGIGERRTYGMGRYRLQTSQGEGTTPPRHHLQSYLQRSSRLNNLELACYNIARKHPYIRQYIDHSLHEFDPDIEEQLNQNTLLNSINLQQLSQSLENSSYQASILQGVILRQASKHPRPLAVPPLEDRIAQRAVVEIMGPDIDCLSTIHSYGYRKGKSRMQARDKILALNRQGYDWFFEADIESFFDLISHDEIENRLQSFFADEPLIPLIMSWIKAPVRFEGDIIERTAGLPQGSPISPMLANLMLEDFDTDLEAAGMKLVRFADDFVILCKNKNQAQQAAKRAEQSLQEMGLKFNRSKTNIGHFSDGFRFLGYTFLNGLAVEGKRVQQAADKLTFSNIPTASWLAKLLQQQPHKIDQLNNTLDKKHRTNKASSIVSSPPPKTQQQILPASEQGSTLFITQPCKYLYKKNSMLEVQDCDTKEIISQINWNDLNSIVLIGRHNISQPCQMHALQQAVPIHYCSSNGQYLGLTTHKQPSQEGAELWLQQMTAYQAGNEQTLQLTRALVAARIHNQIEVIRQRLRHSPADDKASVKAMLKLLQSLKLAENQEQIRGYEGQAAALYFAQIKSWIAEEFNFTTRNKRPAKDPFNALLSLGYTVLYSHTSSILHIAGLYPWQGFYHQGYGRHLALASDLMEPFRHIVERTAITLLRSAQLKAEDFYKLQDGSCRLTQSALKTYLTQLNSRMLKPVVDKNHATAMNMHEQLMRLSNQLIRNIRHPEQPVAFFMLK